MRGAGGGAGLGGPGTGRGVAVVIGWASLALVVDCGQKKTPGRRMGGTRVRVDGWAYSGVDTPGKYEHPEDGHDPQVNGAAAAASNQSEGGPGWRE